MESFIDQIISYAKASYNGDYRKLCVVFPTRRACLIFRNRFAEAHDRTVWSPGIMSIGDFVGKHVKIKIAEEVPLLLTLFDVYKKHWPEQEFGHFFAWGQMLINDFDDVDKQLSDPTRIFSTISELRKIEAAFLPTPESMHWIGDFIASFNTEKLTHLQGEFARSWNRLKQIYSEFNVELDAKGIGYEGKGYRIFINDLKQKRFQSKWDHFVLAGFYGFSRSEEEIIKLIGDMKQVKLFWDADAYYVNNSKHEAGSYFRNTELFNVAKEPFLSDLEKSKIRIEITGVPMLAGQAKFAGELLLKLKRGSQIDLDKTAIVLPDENMLFPVLYSIPAEIDPVNVTMGYPLKYSPYVELIKLLHQTHHHKTESKGRSVTYPAFYIERILTHPLVTGVAPEIRSNTHKIRFSSMDAETVSKNYNFRYSDLFFSHVTTSSSLFSYLESVFNFIIESLSAKDQAGARFEATLLKFVVNEIMELRNHLQEYFHEVDCETAWHMIIECVSNLKVPFSGEPVKGLQVMGFLETRALDFETVIILNLNEGVLPAAGGSRSFIPYSLRKGFGLSTYEDQDASYAYHFYRLLHKAKNVHLVYNTEVNKTGGGEISRYLLQIKHELKKYMGDNLQIIENTVNAHLELPVIVPIIIPKDENIISELSYYKSSSPEENQRYFSSSSLTTYINCSLQFYFRYIAGLKEKEERVNWIEPSVFGNILHGALENLYKSTDGYITVDTIDELSSKSDQAVDEAILKYFFTPVNDLVGNDIILADVIKELVKRILATDKKETPFRITELEGSYTSSFSCDTGLEVKLTGKFDRLDEANGINRIIDYKTGKVKLTSDSIEDLFSDPAKKALFQLYFYTLLYRYNNPGKIIKAGIYMAREIGSGILWPGDGAPFSDEDIGNFSKNLSTLISEILNPAVPFSQTKELKRCKHCEYKLICQR
jgi:RecB family exonuclease